MPEADGEKQKKTNVGGSNQQDSYYHPKTDSSNSVLLHRIEKYNQHLKHQDFGRKYLVPPAGKVLKTPPRQIFQTAISEKDEEAAEVTTVYNQTKAARVLLANQADKAQIRKLYQDSISMEHYLRAGKIFVKDAFTEAGSIFQEVKGYSFLDPKKVTYGDLKMYQYCLKHQDALMEELLAIRKATNARYENGGEINYQKLGRCNALKKKVDRLVSVSEINAFVEFSRNFYNENPEHLTLAQRNILHREGSFFEGHNPVELAANITLIRQILKLSTAAGVFSYLDPENLMNGRDIRRLLNGQMPGLRLEKDVRIFLDAKAYHLFRGGLKSILWNQEIEQKLMKKQQALFGRESMKRWAFQEFKQEMMEDEERKAVLAVVSGARQLEKPIHALETALKSTKAWSVIHKSCVYQVMKVTGKKAANGFKKTGHITQKTTDSL